MCTFLFELLLFIFGCCVLLFFLLPSILGFHSPIDLDLDLVDVSSLSPEMQTPWSSSSPPTWRPVSLLSKAIPVSQFVQHYLKTGSPGLDEFLQGGLPCFGVTEICGKSGTGKTQLCLQFSLMVQLPLSAGGLNSGAIFISTEQVFPSNRLAELIPHFLGDDVLNPTSTPEDPMERIYVERIGDVAALITCLEVFVPAMLRGNQIRLVIIDSLAALFRADYEMSDMRRRTADLRTISIILHDLARMADPSISILVVNQMSASFSAGVNIPSLGYAWTNCLTTRLEMSRRGDSRFIGLKHAPHLPMEMLPIELVTQGIRASGGPLPPAVNWHSSQL